MVEYTNEERSLIKNIVAMLSIKRIPDAEIIKAIYDQTNKTDNKKDTIQSKTINQERILPLV